MDLESVKRFLEKEDGENESTIDSMPAKFIEPFVVHGLKVDVVEPGRLICSLKVPPRLVDAGNLLHGGAMATLVDLLGSMAFHTEKLETFHSGVSVDINVSFVDVAVLGSTVTRGHLQQKDGWIRDWSNITNACGCEDTSCRGTWRSNLLCSLFLLSRVVARNQSSKSDFQILWTHLESQ